MNLILITIDCLRADHLSCLGYSKKITPNLDHLASTGVLFTQAISVSCWTPTSFIAMFTSTYPLMDGGRLYLTDSRTALAQVLKGHGYHTAAFHSNPWLSSHYGYSRGFDTFDDHIQTRRPESLQGRARRLVKRTIGTKSRLYQFLRQAYITMAGGPYGEAEVLNSKAISWLHDNRDDYFLWLHYMDAHGPYLPPSRLASPLKRRRILKLEAKARKSPGGLSRHEVNNLIGAYDAKVSYVDEKIGSLLRVLRHNNILDDTFVIVTADHGEQFIEHGGVKHGLHLYDELIRVPLIIAGPGLGSQVIDQQVSLLNLAPTILDLLKLDKPEAFLGESLLPSTMTKAEANAPIAISEGGRRERGPTIEIRRPRLNHGERKISLRTGQWKYIYTEGEQDELYCLKDDPRETQNLINLQPAIAAELRARIMAHIEFEEETNAPGERGLVKAKIRKLKGSGKI